MPKHKSQEDNDDLQAAFKKELEDALLYLSELNNDRIRTLAHYNMDDGVLPCDEGRSGAKTSEVRDTVHALLPSLMRIFFSSDNVVEYTASKPEYIQLPPNPATGQPTPPKDISGDIAKQQTDYVTKIVLEQDNNAFSLYWQLFKDALLAKAGIVAWWWNKGTYSNPEEYTGINVDELEALQQDPTVIIGEPTPENIEIVQHAVELAQYAAMEQAQQSGQELPPDALDQIAEQIQRSTATFTLTVQRLEAEPKVEVQALPPEEFIIARNARSVKTASIVGQRTVKTVSELIELGIDPDIAYSYKDDYGADTQLMVFRNTINPYYMQDSINRTDDASLPVNYTEAYIRYDLNGDGVAELLKIKALGQQNEIVDVTPVDEAPYAIFCPDPIPHEAIGSCPADAIVDIQRIKTQILRDTLDSLAISVDPKLAYVEGRVDVEDLQNRSVGSLIRQYAPDSVQPVTMPFVGSESLPVLSYLDTIKEDRTGASKASMGLNAEALQSSTAIAVDATVQAATARVELIARIFAETGFKDMYRGILRLLIKHQDRPRTVKLRGGWVNVDPSKWDKGLGLNVNLGVYGLTDTQKAQTLMLLLQKQEQAMAQGGFTNPLANLKNYRATLAQLLSLGGYKNPLPFLQEVDDQTLIMLEQQQAMAAKQPKPEDLVAQSVVKMNNAQALKFVQDAKNDVMKLYLSDEFNRDKLQSDVQLKQLDMQGKYGMKAQLDMLNHIIEQHRLEAEQDHEKTMQENEFLTQAMMSNDNGSQN